MAIDGFLRFIQVLRQSLAGAVRRRVRPSSSVHLELLEARCVLTAMIIVDPVADLFTDEAGGATEFTVVLSEQPTKDVKIPISSSNTKEGKIDSVTDEEGNEISGVKTKELKFTSENWDQPQTVTVTGVDDKVADGDKDYSIILKPAKGDKLYAKQDVADLSIVNEDDDEAGVVIDPDSELETTEEGGKTTFSVTLASQPLPKTSVVLVFESSDAAEGTVLAKGKATSLTLKFTDKNWDKPQKVTITGVDDSIDDDDLEYEILVDSSLSTDSNYAELTVDSVLVTNIDDDTDGGQPEPEPQNLDGDYTGEASGKVKSLLGEMEQTLPLAFSVLGDKFTVTEPGDYTGTITAQQGTFTIPDGTLKGATFTGGFTVNDDGSVTFAGTWSIKQSGLAGINGSGTLTATRPAP